MRRIREWRWGWSEQKAEDLHDQRGCGSVWDSSANAPTLRTRRVVEAVALGRQYATLHRSRSRTIRTDSFFDARSGSESRGCGDHSQHAREDGRDAAGV